MLNLCNIVVAILKMPTARNCSMSGIYSGHHNLPTYEMSLKLDNVLIPNIEQFLPVAIFKMVAAKIQHCPISSKFDIWVDNDVPPLKSNNVEFLRYCDGHFENGDR
jgi:hypothetical protein